MICYSDEKEVERIISLTECGGECLICGECLVSYVKSQVGQLAFDPASPAPLRCFNQCGASLPLDSLLS